GDLPSATALAQLRRRWTTFFVLGSYDQPQRMYAARGVLAGDGTVLGVIEVSRDVSDAQALLNTLRLVLVAAGCLALVAALVASLLFARQMVRPLRDIESATQVIAGGDFSRRLDVTSGDEIGRLAASINTMAADLARLDASRRAFLAKVSHDLRTPLTAIKGLVANLQDTAPEDMQPSLATVDEQTERLVRLVNDLLTLSRLQRGELSLRRTRVDLTNAAEQATLLVAGKASRMGISLDLDLADSLAPVSADPDRLQQVIINLLDNAFKVTPAGGTIQVKTASSGSEVTFTVLDSGLGVTDEVAARAFEPYFSSTGGAGLGLTIAREIVTAHGGRIWLVSRAGEGAECGFALPQSTDVGSPDR
ncbi:MAG: ATP-binding protein, partial [Anaerolineae bacterium]